ncbi:MAG: hypothetical protein VCF24_16420 [Candidatus Latescibacterota bacterium]
MSPNPSHAPTPQLRRFRPLYGRECGLLLRTRRLSPAACLRLLRAGGYDGCLSIKSVGSSPDGPAAAFRRSLDNIRGLVASLTS